jgi:hypothetical protein
MGAIPHPKILAAIALLLLGLTAFRALVKRDKSAASKIDLDYLLIDPATGQISKAAAVMLVALGVTTWMMVYLTMSAKLTEGYFGLYLGAWVAPTVTKLIVGGKPAGAP